MATTNLALTEMPSNSLQPSVPFNADILKIDAAIAGTLTIEFSSDANLTLTEAQYQQSALVFTDSPSTLTAGRDVVFPDHFPLMYVKNSTAQTLTLKKSGQSGVTVLAGAEAIVGSGASDVVKVSGGGTASQISIVDAGAYFTGTDVEAALQELGAGGGGGGGLTHFTEAANSSAPNGTVPVVSLAATNAATNVDVALAPKGTGGLAAHIADSASTGGNKRGASAVDWQTVRSVASQAATGSQSVIGGGSANTASFANSTVAGGISNTASAAYATVTGGNSNTASGQYSTAGGRSNVASGAQSTAFGHTNTASVASATAFGQNGTANGITSFVMGTAGNARSIANSRVLGSGTGRQETCVVLYKNTTDATPTVLISDGGAASATNQYALSSGMASCLNIMIVARQTAGTGTGAVHAWQAFALIKNISGTTSLEAAVTPTTVAGSTSWTVAVTADSTNDTLVITVTGEASKTIQWTARIVGVDA
jgi:hypothetical protein